jgi:predicted Zn-dependent protease with MMP-like domain
MQLVKQEEQQVQKTEDQEVEDITKQMAVEAAFSAIQPMIEGAADSFSEYLKNDKGGRVILIKEVAGKVYVLDIEKSGIVQDIVFDTSKNLIGNYNKVEVTDLTTFLVGLAKSKV